MDFFVVIFFFVLLREDRRFFFFFGGKWTELSREGMDLVIVRKNGLSY